MKLSGKQISAPEPIPVILTRKPKPIILMCASIIDYSEFERYNPEPVVPVLTRTGKLPVKDPTDPNYLIKVKTHSDRRHNWMIIQSLMATEGLEFETVDLEDGSTYENFEKELEEIFTPFEVMKILNTVIHANVPQEMTMDQALKVFQDSDQAAAKSEENQSSGSIEPMNTPSGEPVSG